MSAARSTQRRRVVLLFRRTGDPAVAERAKTLLAAAREEATSAAAVAINAERRAALTEAATLIGQYATNFDVLIARLTAREALEHREIVPLAADLHPLFDVLLAGARVANNAPLVAETAAAQESLLLAELAIARFLAGGSRRRPTRAAKDLETLAGRVDTLRSGSWGASQAERLQQLAGLVARYRAVFTSLVPIVLEADRIVDHTNAQLGEQISALLARTSDSQNEALRQTREAVQATLDGTSTRGTAMAAGRCWSGCCCRC